MEQQDCTKVITIPQYTGSCWFNAIMMSTFYSEGMRKLLLTKLPSWEASKQSKKIITDMLLKHYTYSNHEHMAFFNKFRPEKLLKELHLEDPTVFDFNPDVSEGYASGRYMYKLLRYLGITDFSILDAIDTGKDHDYNVYYGQYNVIITNPKNHNFKAFGKASPAQTAEYLSKSPEVLLIMTKRSTDVQFYPTHYYKARMKFDPIIKYNGDDYIADSMIVSNFNQGVCKMGHEICGITCGNQRYMYNGWMKHSQDKGMVNKMFNHVPCALMKHDWLDRSLPGFCIDHKNCDLLYHKDKNKEAKELCFSYTKGPRVYTYIRADLLKKKTAVKKKPAQPKPDTVKTCPEGKVLNPKTGRCVNATGKLGQSLSGPQKAKASCEDGKIMNPKTGKCVNIQGKVGQEVLKSLCPEDKVYNIKTKKCVKKNGKVGKSIIV